MSTTAILPAAGILLAGAALLGDYPQYGVEAGTELTRTYVSTTTLESGPAQMFFGDQEVPREGHGEMRLEVEDSRTITFQDTVAAVAGGRPTKFSRAYGELSNSATETLKATPPGGEEEARASTRERVSPLAGQTVVFAWDEKEEEYARTCDAKDFDKELLEDLQPDADWLPLLEGGPREKGASFELDPKLFQRVQNPAGDLHWKVEGQEADPVSKAINEQLAENLGGKAKATWEGEREIDGRKVGVFAIEAELESEAEAETPDGAEKRGVELELGYEGEVWWDLAAGRLAGYALEAEVRSVLSTTRTIESPKGEVEVRQVFDLRGKAKHGLRVTEG